MNKKEKEIKQVLEKLKEKDLKTMEKFKEKNNDYYQLDGKIDEKKELESNKQWCLNELNKISKKYEII